MYGHSVKTSRENPISSHGNGLPPLFFQEKIEKKMNVLYKIKKNSLHVYVCVGFPLMTLTPYTDSKLIKYILIIYKKSYNFRVM